MPDLHRLSQQDYDILASQVRALGEDLRNLDAALSSLAPGMRSNDAGYREMHPKIRGRIQDHLRRSQVLLHAFTVLSPPPDKEDKVDVHSTD